MLCRTVSGPGFWIAATALSMARRVAPNEYGLLQGSNASLMGMAGIVGPLVFTQILACERAMAELVAERERGGPFRSLGDFAELTSRLIASRIEPAGLHRPGGTSFIPSE